MGHSKLTRRRGMRVLVVEDEPLLAMALEDALRDAGAGEVITCHTMAATVAELDKGRPDAVVLDVHLADRDDGWALAELIELIGPGRVRIVFSTGSPQDIPESVRSLGPVFAKPYDTAELARAVLAPDGKGLIGKLRQALG